MSVTPTLASKIRVGLNRYVTDHVPLWVPPKPLPGLLKFCCRPRYVASAAHEVWNVGNRHDRRHITVWLRSMMFFGSGLPNGDCHYARTLFRQACNDRPHSGKLAGTRD